jgi:hypothetical protein
MAIRQHNDAELLQSCEAFALEQASTLKVRSDLAEISYTLLV